ncbi:hypothetical protein BDV97DRAFT_368086 [Delphinella strobiligena]|nr:hypothetical protein BDV97DRAFT_368086 [Delphinella strobiligena]
MPHIEELPTTAKAAAPGYSYVVDNGYDPSKLAINPTNRKRKHISASGGPTAGDLSARQQTAIQRHLEELDRDSHKPVTIPIPRSKTESDGKKQTTNTKRIFASGKDFSHYLEEEEAALALKNGGVETTVGAAETAEQPPPKPVHRPSKTPIARRKSAIMPSSNESSPGPSTGTGSMAPPPLPPPKDVTRGTPSTTTIPIPPSDLLLAPVPPTTITESEIDALLAAPPLPYSAARSAPPPQGGPHKRVFCEMCGYWGRVKCMKCGARVCGFECQTAHDESRCVRF